MDELGQRDIIGTLTSFCGNEFCGNESKRSHSVVVMRNNVEYNPGIPSQPLRVQDKE